MSSIVSDYYTEAVADQLDVIALPSGVAFCLRDEAQKEHVVPSKKQKRVTPEELVGKTVIFTGKFEMERVALVSVLKDFS